MKNIEKYEKELKKYGTYFTLAKGVGILDCKDISCVDCTFYGGCAIKRMNWLLEEYKEPILTDEEKEYLNNLIKHFRNYIKYIERETEDFYNGEQLESINIWMEKGDIGNLTIIPIVETSLTFEGMEDERQYSLEELGL